MIPRRSILLVGTDRYVLDACLRRDLDVVLVRGFHSFDAGQVDVPPGVTVLAVEDQRNPESVLAALARAGRDSPSFDAVQTTNEQSLVTTATLGHLFGCAMLSPKTAVLFRDKWLQKETVRRAGIPTARSTFLPDIRNLGDVQEELPYERAVLKPAAGAATALTAVVSDSAELRSRAAEFRRSSGSTRQYVLEEFVDGDEWVADGIVHQGALEFVALGIYGLPCLTAIDQSRTQRTRRFDPVDDAWAYQMATPLVADAIAALGLANGVFHMELFHNRRELFFSECAARRGGGLIQEEVQSKFGVDLADAAVQLALREPPDLEVTSRSETVGTTFLTGPTGLLLSCPTPAELCARDGVRFARVEVPRGAIIPKKADDTNTRVGIALMTADSNDELLRRMDDLAAWFADAFEVMPADASLGELRQWQRHTWPHVDFDGGLFTPQPGGLAVSRRQIGSQTCTVPL